MSDWQQEMAALTTLLEALLPLSHHERERVLRYLWDRFVTHPPAEESAP